MKRLTTIILISLSLIGSSCETRRSKIDRRHLIPEKELVSILTDLYITDGLIGMPRMIMNFQGIDSSSTYNHVIEKHGYTKATMDKTMKYYFIKDPKELIKIYDKVLGILVEMESRVQKELANSKTKTGSLWPDLDAYYFPDPSGTDSTDFDITLKRAGTYILTASVTLFPDDQSLNPGISAFTCNPDSIQTGKRNYIDRVYYIKDGHVHKYSVVFTVPAKTNLHVRGSLYDFDNHPNDWAKHVIIQNISFIYSLV